MSLLIKAVIVVIVVGCAMWQYSSQWEIRHYRFTACSLRLSVVSAITAMWCSGSWSKASFTLGVTRSVRTVSAARWTTPTKCHGIQFGIVWANPICSCIGRTDMSGMKTLHVVLGGLSVTPSKPASDSYSVMISTVRNLKDVLGFLFMFFFSLYLSLSCNSVWCWVELNRRQTGGLKGFSEEEIEGKGGNAFAHFCFWWRLSHQA